MPTARIEAAMASMSVSLRRPLSGLTRRSATGTCRYSPAPGGGPPSPVVSAVGVGSAAVAVGWAVTVVLLTGGWGAVAVCAVTTRGAGAARHARWRGGAGGSVGLAERDQHVLCGGGQPGLAVAEQLVWAGGHDGGDRAGHGQHRPGQHPRVLG